MADLGEIFHVKKSGVQYDAHAYTTLNECPEPNLKIKYKGQQGYVKLVDKGEGDVPCYVKVTSGTIYQVKKQAIPSGSMTITSAGTYSVPTGINRIKVVGTKGTFYFNVQGSFQVTLKGPTGLHFNIYHLLIQGEDVTYNTHPSMTVYWGPDINNK